MTMEKFEYCGLLRQLNEEQRLIYDVMHRNQFEHDTPICLFLIGDAGIGKKFTLKFIIQDYYDFTIETYLLT